MTAHLLVTGASGFIGRHVSAEALRRGYRVTGVDIRPSPAGNVPVITADIRDRERMLHLTRDIDHVIHLAAITSNVEFIEHPADSHHVNVSGFLNVLDAAARNGCQRFVYASSAAVYADGFSEDTSIDGGAHQNHYAKSKLMNEMLAASYASIFPLTAIGLRYFNVYGRGENTKGGYASIVTLFLQARQRGEPMTIYGDGSQARDLVHVADAARLTLEVLERGRHSIYNVGTGVATSYTRIAEMIDGNHIQYVPNPLGSYQLYTRADIRRIRELVGPDQLTGLPEAVAEMRAVAGLGHRAQAVR